MNASLKARLQALSRILLLGLVALLLAWPAAAAPVNWQEVPASEAGRQWWDSGSLRVDRNGHLSVLSRFQPQQAADQSKPPLADLYVMQLDCDQGLYRDTSVNGLPRWNAEWQLAGGDALTAAVLEAACQAGADLFKTT